MKSLILFIFVNFFLSVHNVDCEKKILSPYKASQGPIKFDWSIGPKLWKELQGGIVRFYASNLLIMVQHVRQAAPDSAAEGLEVIKKILGRILRGGTSYSHEMYELGRAFANLRNKNVRQLIKTDYKPTPGPSLEWDQENSDPSSPGLIRRIWSTVQSWTRRITGTNQANLKKSSRNPSF